MVESYWIVAAAALGQFERGKAAMHQLHRAISEQGGWRDTMMETDRARIQTSNPSITGRTPTAISTITQMHAISDTEISQLDGSVLIINTSSSLEIWKEGNRKIKCFELWDIFIDWQ